MVLDRIAPVLARFIKSAVLFTNVLSLSIIINIPLYIYFFFILKQLLIRLTGSSFGEVC